ncbi:MAG: hypothetical protein A3F10_05180 [Coxiella sp. RIFCSPHIGHO2_12_FULL_42_15]|nr:MAG: hypothetical protein A3F10_05180 [Coxiella sp. RIFCSPHIGHO2_12_FULL_42_15]
MLLALRDYFIQKQTANLQEIAWHFKQPPEMMRALLEHWIRKGKICRCEKPAHCGMKCQRCKPEVAEVYQWL